MILSSSSQIMNITTLSHREIIMDGERKIDKGTIVS